MYKTKSVYKKVDVKDYKSKYLHIERFLNLCKECHNFNNRYSCPPYEFDINEFIDKYKYAYIIGTKIIVDKNKVKPEDIYPIIKEVRVDLDKKLIEKEKKYNNSLALFAGCCVLCDTCEKEFSRPCKNPDLLRYSFESLGFDVTSTAKEVLDTEILWSKNGEVLDYYFLVAGFFTNEENLDLNGLI